jgi:mRNA interferase RelE/StbE
MPTSKRATVYLDPDLHRSLRIKAAETDQTVSELVNEAVRSRLAADVDDLVTFRQRAKEPRLAPGKLFRAAPLPRKGVSLAILKSAAKELEGVPAKERERVVTRIAALASDSRPPGAEKLSGGDKYRVRAGGYRVLYQIDDHATKVVVVKIARR